MVNWLSKLSFERTVPVMLCERSRSKFCVNRPSRIVPGGTVARKIINVARKIINVPRKLFYVPR